MSNSSGKGLKFDCGEETIKLPFTKEYSEEIDPDTKPVIRRVYIHQDHAHVLKFDNYGDMRGCPKKDLYRGKGLQEGTETKYKCSETNQEIKFKAKTRKQNPNKGNSELYVPPIDTAYSCIHIHESTKNQEKHAHHLRITSQGRVEYNKILKMVKE